MNAERLLALFEPISEAPDAIARLRRFILDLAVRGKLVEQDPADEPAELLLQFLQKQVRKSDSSTSKGDYIPFILPIGWVPATLGDLVQASSSGWSPKTLDLPREGEEWGILKVSAVSWERFQPDANKQVLPGTQPKPQAVVKKGDFLISRANTAELVARAVIVDCNPVNLMMSDKIVRLQLVELCEPRYILIVNNHATFARSHYASHATGVSPSMKNVSRDVILGLPLPLPPLAEQHRIVAKVDELMALCDQLEAARQQREQCRERLVAASLQRLNQPSDEPDAFRSDARFALQVLPSFTSTPAQIKQLRQTILNLAVRGKLVEQDPEDEPAGELLRAVLKTPWQKKRKPIPTAFDDKSKSLVKLTLPDSWTWATVESIVPPDETVTYGILKPVWLADGVPTVRVTEMKTGSIDTSRLPCCDPVRAEKFRKTTLKEWDLLVSKDGTIGKTAFVPAGLAGGNITQHVIRLPISCQLCKPYIRIAIDSPYCQSYMRGETKGVALQGVNVGDFRKMPIPLPPLAEQHRIVAKVDELMALCDQLEQQLSQAEQSRRGLLEAVLREALEGEIAEATPSP